MQNDRDCMVRAHGCERVAVGSTDAEIRNEWLKLSIEWHYLAHYCEKRCAQRPKQVQSCATYAREDAQ